MQFTHTTTNEWDAGGHKLGSIPSSPEKQVQLLEYAVYELFEWLMDELGYDNPGSIADRLADEVNKIAHRAYERGCKIKEQD